MLCKCVWPNAEREIHKQAKAVKRKNGRKEEKKKKKKLTLYMCTFISTKNQVQHIAIADSCTHITRQYDFILVSYLFYYRQYLLCLSSSLFAICIVYIYNIHFINLIISFYHHCKTFVYALCNARIHDESET